MTHVQRTRVLYAIVLAALLGFALTGILAAQGGVNIQRIPALRIDHWLTVAGATTLNGGLTMDTNKFTVADTSGNTAVGGTLDVTGATTLSSSIAQTLVNATGGSANPYDYTGTLGIMNGSDDFTLFDINITNANHTGASNTVQAIVVAGVTQDAQSQENAINLGAGWDLDLNGATSLEVGVDNTVVVTVKDPAAVDAGVTTDSVEVTLTTPADTAGTNTHNGLDVALTIGNATAGTNAVNAINITNITGDAQVTEYGLNVGTGFDRGINVAGGGAVIVGTFTVDNGEIGIAEIANISRTVTIPLNSLFECTTDAGAAIGYTDGADAHPHFANSSTNGLGAVLRFDDTGGSIDTDYVCGQLMVPQDYAGQAQFNLRVLKDAETGDNTEVVNCAGSINGAALGTASTVTVTGTASQSVACAPTLSALAAGDSLSFEFHITSGGTADDVVDVAAIEFRYTASE